jgi:hypothetical protein
LEPIPENAMVSGIETLASVSGNLILMKSFSTFLRVRILLIQVMARPLGKHKHDVSPFHCSSSEEEFNLRGKLDDDDNNDNPKPPKAQSAPPPAVHKPKLASDPDTAGRKKRGA